MKIWVANIGGSTGYINLLNRMKNLPDTLKIPDKIITQECGSTERFPGLEPFFDKFTGTNQIRLHEVKNNPIADVRVSKNPYHIISFTFEIKINKSKMMKIGFIGAYRNHANKPTLFIREIDKICQKFNKSTEGFCLAGDFNLTNDDPTLNNLTDKFNLISRTTCKHQHRSNVRAKQIDHVLTNLSLTLCTVQVILLRA